MVTRPSPARLRRRGGISASMTSSRSTVGSPARTRPARGRIGSPVLVTAMMAVLFRPGAFDGHGAAGVGPAQVVFWVAFAGFFFGLTYGLLQIVGEQAIFRREHRSGLSAGAYVAAKVSVLVPVLIVVAAVLLGVLRALDRLPAAGLAGYAALLVTLVAE